MEKLKKSIEQVKKDLDGFTNNYSNEVLQDLNINDLEALQFELNQVIIEMDYLRIWIKYKIFCKEKFSLFRFWGKKR